MGDWALDDHLANGCMGTWDLGTRLLGSQSPGQSVPWHSVAPSYNVHDKRGHNHEKVEQNYGKDLYFLQNESSTKEY